MGKNFPQVFTLKEKPSLFEPTLKLIEKSFHYQKENSFKTDFAPLIDESNHHNCFILVNESDGVLAHIGVCERNLNDFPIAMLGGIAVDEKARGEGHFNTLMQHVMAEKRDEVAFFILWSDLEKLYKKFGFHLCGAQYEIEKTQGESGYTKTKFKNLTSPQREIIKKLYNESFAKEYLTLKRENWDLLEKIESADLFIKEDSGTISDYFFMNKGQDLTGVIYEYGTTRNISNVVAEAQREGKVWTGKALIDTETVQYLAFICPADTRLFSQFIHKYTQGKISIREINQMKQEVYFDFNEELIALEVEEFLRGVFGPGVFEELEVEMKPLFLSGLDSV